MRISDWSSDVCSSDLKLARSADHVTEIHELKRAVRHVRVRSRDERRHVDTLRVRIAVQNRAKCGDTSEDGIHFVANGETKQLEIGRAACRERVCQYE